MAALGVSKTRTRARIWSRIGEISGSDFYKAHQLLRRPTMKYSFEETRFLIERTVTEEECRLVEEGAVDDPERRRAERAVTSQQRVLVTLDALERLVTADPGDVRHFDPGGRVLVLGEFAIMDRDVVRVTAGELTVRRPGRDRALEYCGYDDAVPFPWKRG